jgi:hypothetical protein
MKNKQWMWKICEKVIYFELFGENCMKIIVTGQIMNYQGFQNNQVNLYEFFLLGT